MRICCLKIPDIDIQLMQQRMMKTQLPNDNFGWIERTVVLKPWTDL